MNDSHTRIQPGKLTSLLKIFINNSPDIFGRDQWTIDILRLLVFATCIPVVGIVLVYLLGLFSLEKTVPIVISFLLLVIGWQIAKRGFWRWVGLFPPVINLFLGAFALYNDWANNTPVIMLSMAVILAGSLLGNRTSILFVFISTFAFSLSLYRRLPVISVTFVADTIVVFFCLLAIALIQWYIFSRLHLNIQTQFNTNRALEDEMSRRQQAEEIQRIQESQLKRLTDHMTDMVAEMDLSGNYLFISPSYSVVLGYSLQELMSKKAYDMVFPEDLPSVKEAINKVVETGNPSRIQYRVRHANGQYIWVESSGKSIYRNPSNEKSIVFSSRDITQQKLAEENNIASERKFQSIIDAIPMGIHMFSLENSHDLIFYGYNPSADDILGIDHSAFIGKEIEIAFLGLKSTEIPERYRHVAQTGMSWTGVQVIDVNEKSKKVFEVHAFQTAPGKMAVLFSDITEKIQTENALKLSEDKFSKVFFTSPDTISISRFSDGLFIDVNPSFTKFLGFERDEAIGKTSQQLNVWVNPGDRAELIQGLSPENPTSKMEIVLRAKDGHFITVLMSATIITINEEKYLLIILRDITERIQSEQKLIDAHAELEHAYEATLQGWARALELREHETADHSRRVVDMTIRIARELHFSEEDLINIERGALLHDIGKMGVPDNILLKPGPLSSDEWVIMRQHPVYAHHLLKDVEYLRSAMEIPYCHHEHWDGTGYPRGLKEKEIPLTARIFTLVDVWDALLSNRPYRPAWDKQTVRNYLQEQSGKLLDPEIVSLFIALTANDLD